MKRLTEWNGEQNRHAYYPRCFEEPCSGGGCKIEGCPFEAEACDRLAAYEDTGLTLEDCENAAEAKQLMDATGLTMECVLELLNAVNDGRCVVLPCKYDERWADEDGRAVRITATTVTVDDFGTHTNVYFTYEHATSCDDADSDCMANWDYFSRRFTREEAERAMEGQKNG